MNKVFVCLILLLLLQSLSGCSLFRSSARETSEFLPYDESLAERRERAPFHGFWVRDEAMFRMLKDSYVSVYILPVNTRPAIQEIKNHRYLSASEREERLSELDEIARYMGEKFRAAVRDRMPPAVKLLDEYEQNAFVLELAIVDIYPTKAVSNVFKTVAGFFIPGTGILSRVTDGAIAVEGVIRDGKTGTALASFKDKESNKLSIFSIKDFQRYGFVRLTVDEWAMQYAELLSTPFDHMVDESATIIFNPL